jgi:hypothetical protein
MSDDIVERYRIRKREQSFPVGCFALSGFVFTLFAILVVQFDADWYRVSKDIGWQ